MELGNILEKGVLGRDNGIQCSGKNAKGPP